MRRQLPLISYLPIMVSISLILTCFDPGLMGASLEVQAPLDFNVLDPQVLDPHICKYPLDELGESPKAQFFYCWRTVWKFVENYCESKDEDHVVIVVYDFDGTMREDFRKQQSQEQDRKRRKKTTTQEGVQYIVNDIIGLKKVRPYILTSRPNSPKSVKSILRFTSKFKINLKEGNIRFSSPSSSLMKSKGASELIQENINKGVEPDKISLIAIDNDERTLRDLLANAGKKDGDTEADYLIPEGNIHILHYEEEDRCKCSLVR